MGRWRVVEISWSNHESSSRLRRRNAASVSAAVSTLAVTKFSAAAAAAVVATGCRSTTTWSLWIFRRRLAIARNRLAAPFRRAFMRSLSLTPWDMIAENPQRHAR